MTANQIQTQIATVTCSIYISFFDRYVFSFFFKFVVKLSHAPKKRLVTKNELFTIFFLSGLEGLGLCLHKEFTVAQNSEIQGYAWLACSLSGLVSMLTTQEGSNATNSVLSLCHSDMNISRKAVWLVQEFAAMNYAAPKSKRFAHSHDSDRGKHLPSYSENRHQKRPFEVNHMLRPPNSLIPLKKPRSEGHSSVQT